VTTIPEMFEGWRKSSWSPNGTDCVEVDRTLSAVRDSKNPSVVLTSDLRAFVAWLRNEGAD
jgi:hypothetical protein